jgi:hypothetical protein
MKCLILKQSQANDEETIRPLDTTYQMTYYEKIKDKEIKHLGWFMNVEKTEQLDELLRLFGSVRLELRGDLSDGEFPVRVLTIEGG